MEDKRTLLGFPLSDNASSGVSLSKWQMPFPCHSLCMSHGTGVYAGQAHVYNEVLPNTRPRDLGELIATGFCKAESINGPPKG